MREFLPKLPDIVIPVGVEVNDLRRAGMVTDPERQTVNVATAAKILGCSRTTAYEAVRTGQLPSIRLGNRILISRRVLEDLLQRGSAPGDAT